MRRPRRSTLFPYTPLFRSVTAEVGLAAGGLRVVAATFDVVEHVVGVEGARGPAEEVERRLVVARLQHLAEILRLGLRHQVDRKSTRLNSSHANISYAVFCL